MKLRESQYDIHVLHLEGEIDLHYAPALRTVFEAHVKRRCPALVADLGAVSFIDSTGIAVFIEDLRDAAAFQGQFCIAGLTQPVRYIFEVVQLHKAIPIFNSANDAIGALRSGTIAKPVEPLFRPAEPDSASVAA